MTCKICAKNIFLSKGTWCNTNISEPNGVSVFHPVFDHQHLLWWLISLVQEVPTLHRRRASGGMVERIRDGGKEQSRRGKPCWEKGNLPCAEAEWLEDISR